MLDIYTEYKLHIKNNTKGVGEGGAGGGARASPLSKVGGGTSGFAPPPLLGRANVLISLFAHILWLKHIFSQNFLGSLRSPTLITQYFLYFANLKLKNNFHIFFSNYLTIYTYIYHYINCVPTCVFNLQI